MPKAKRRAHLYGKGVSIYFKEDQNRWMCELRRDGTRKTIAGSKGANYEECEEKFRQGIEEARKNARQPPKSVQMLEEYLHAWIEEKMIALRKATYPQWKRYLDDYVIAYLGALSLCDVNRGHLQEWIGKLVKRGLAASTIHLIHRILKLAMRDAVKRGLLIANPCETLTLPRVEEKEMAFLDVEQARLFLAHLKIGGAFYKRPGPKPKTPKEQAQARHPHEALFTLAITAGLRRGELMGLRWEDLDLNRRIVTVRRTVGFVAKQGYHENEPKSSAGRRTIALTGETVEALRIHQDRLGCTTGLVFPGRFGGYFSPKGMEGALNDLLEACGLPHIRFHDLRHTFATLTLKSGVDLKTLQYLMGHANIQTTLRYVHVLPDSTEAAIARLENLLFAA